MRRILDVFPQTRQRLLMHYLPLNEKKLKALVKKSKHYNIFPIFLPNYLPDVGQHPITDLFSELVEEASGYLSIASTAEIESLLDSLPPGITMMIGRRPEFEKNDQLRRIAIYYVVSEVQRRYLSFKQVIEDDTTDSEVLKIYPELADRFDKDGLLHIDSELILHDGGIGYRDHILHYHQLLRREYTSNPNFDFLSKFLRYYRKTRDINRFHIAIDHRRIMKKKYYSQIMEFDTWYGPSFNREGIDDPQGVGLTIVKRNKDSLFELTNSLDRTEFFWSYRNGIKTFQIEEISDEGYRFEHYYFNKYVHSERDILRRITRHIDGAVKVYLQDSYPKRRNSFMPDEFKNHSKIKLWRIDGDIDIDSWIRLISFFYKSNEMIIEYFNPKEFKEIFEERVRDFKEWKSKQQDSKEDS